MDASPGADSPGSPPPILKPKPGRPKGSTEDYELGSEQSSATSSAPPPTAPKPARTPSPARPAAPSKATKPKSPIKAVPVTEARAEPKVEETSKSADETSEGSPSAKIDIAERGDVKDILKDNNNIGSMATLAENHYGESRDNLAPESGTPLFAAPSNLRSASSPAGIGSGSNGNVSSTSLSGMNPVLTTVSPVTSSVRSVTPVYINPGRLRGKWVSPLVPSSFSQGPITGTPSSSSATSGLMSATSTSGVISASPTGSTSNISPHLSMSNNGEFNPARRSQDDYATPDRNPYNVGQSSSSLNQDEGDSPTKPAFRKASTAGVSSLSIGSVNGKPGPRISCPSPAALRTSVTGPTDNNLSSGSSSTRSPIPPPLFPRRKSTQEVLDVSLSTVERPSVPKVIEEHGPLSASDSTDYTKNDKNALSDDKPQEDISNGDKTSGGLKRAQTELVKDRVNIPVQEQYQALLNNISDQQSARAGLEIAMNDIPVAHQFPVSGHTSLPANLIFANSVPQLGSTGGRIQIPERTDSKNPMNAKCYSELSPDEWVILQTAALTRFNILARKYKIKPLPSEFLKTLSMSIYGTTDKRKWWAKFKKDAKDGSGAEVVPRSIVKAPIVTSIEYASIPYATTLSDADAQRRIPIIVHECVKQLRLKGLTEKGIFRVNGSEKRIVQVFSLFDQPPHFGLNANCEQYTVYDIADFLKRYLRQLPEPLLTMDMYDSFLRTLDVPFEGGIRIRALRLLLMMLPPPHLITLECLLALFHEVVDKKEENSMTANSIARIFSPNFLKPPKGREQQLEEYDLCTQVVETLIDYWDHFIITSDQIRPFQLLDVTFASMAEFISLY